MPVTEEHPGRRYVGVSTTGVRLTTAEIRMAEVLMAAGQLLLDRVRRSAADPYLTLVGYFNATRELAGMARYLADDVQTALAKGRPWSRLPRRTGTDFGSLNIAELTSRVSSADITGTLDQMAVAVRPGLRLDRRQARACASCARRQDAVPKREANPYDAVLATSMLQVGVDVTRLGLMLMVGQPKNTAEYIQASSRVGRDPAGPGLVVTLGNWARPRDLAHFEQFRHYHETFYAAGRGAVGDAVLGDLDGAWPRRGARQRRPGARRDRRATGCRRSSGAGRIDDRARRASTRSIDALVARVARAVRRGRCRAARQRLLNRLDQWVKRRDVRWPSSARRWSTSGSPTTASTGRCMISAENARSRRTAGDAPPFVVANSMREVQPEINLLVSPIKEQLLRRRAARRADVGARRREERLMTDDDDRP